MSFVIAKSSPRGHVFLVGAGPGDPDLLTVKALRILQSARVVAYDELVSPAILDLAPPDAERIAVGRRKGTCPNAPSIHAAVLERALEGHDVVRLKGGDPMIFGRGGEEAAELTAVGIPFTIVPGISAALGAAASTGIPLTHRDASASVTFATAQPKWDDARDPLAGLPLAGTLVLYMGLAKLGEIATRLVESGRPNTTPAAVISHATLPDERIVTGTLADIAARVATAELPTPALIVVGDVVDRRVISAVPVASLQQHAQRRPSLDLPRQPADGALRVGGLRGR